MLKIGVLASHEGTTLQCILDACAAGRIQGKVAVVISNNAQLRRAFTGEARAFGASSLVGHASNARDVGRGHKRDTFCSSG
jgi:folate-dependent phosphoribosylglycinamide formyltransferase PurN